MLKFCPLRKVEFTIFNYFTPPQPPIGGELINQQLAKSPPWGI